MSVIIGKPVIVGGGGSSGGVAGLNNAIRFSSLQPFTLATANSAKNWDGQLEWTDGENDWVVWDGTTPLSATSGFLALRGTGNTKITGNSYDYRWVLTGSNIRCDGNIETLLDYAIVAAGNHPTMTDYCYTRMFQGCTSLTTAPALPATTLAKSCYTNMFNGCTALTTAPALPATTLANYCYNGMFWGCTSLTTAPALPATTLTDFCYSIMFQGCTSLTTAPTLSATTLVVSCYNGMFQNCTSLTTVPTLPATTLVKNCYNGMFKNCASLKFSASQIGEYIYPYRIPTSGTGTAISSSLLNMFTGTGGTFTGTPSINTTYYTTKPPVAA